jgi:hypothetical protein
MSDILWTILGIVAYIYGVVLLAACIGRGMDDGHK